MNEIELIKEIRTELIERINRHEDDTTKRQDRHEDQVEKKIKSESEQTKHTLSTFMAEYETMRRSSDSVIKEMGATIDKIHLEQCDTRHKQDNLETLILKNEEDIKKHIQKHEDEIKEENEKKKKRDDNIKKTVIAFGVTILTAIVIGFLKAKGIILP